MAKKADKAKIYLKLTVDLKFSAANIPATISEVQASISLILPSSFSSLKRFNKTCVCCPNLDPFYTNGSKISQVS
jgi:hypothetical protein